MIRSSASNNVTMEMSIINLLLLIGKLNYYNFYKKIQYGGNVNEETEARERLD